MKTRNCPVCNKELVYDNHNSFYRARKLNSKCKSCMQSGKNNSFYGKQHSETTRILYSECRQGKNNPMYGRESAMFGKLHKEETIQKMSSKRKLYWKNNGSNTTEFQKYRNRVDVLTAKQPIHLLENFEKRGRAGVAGAYHLDHIKSVWYGFHNDIEPEKIADIKNLRMIPWLENQQKWYK